MLDYKIIGERLKKARIMKKMTQENLANQLDISVAFLSRVERGSSSINLKRLNQICEILKVSEGEILNGTSNNLKSYLEKDFKELFDKTTNDKKELIYRIANTIIESN